MLGQERTPRGYRRVAGLDERSEERSIGSAAALLV